MADEQARKPPNLAIDGMMSGDGMSMNLWVANRVRTRRILIGMSREEFARRMGVQPNQTRNWELGRDKMSPQRLWDAATALSIDVGWFFAAKDGEDYHDGMKAGVQDMAVAQSPWAFALALDLAKLPNWQREFVEACVARFKRANDGETPQ